MEARKPFEVRKLFRVLVMGGGLIATACGSGQTCPAGTTPQQVASPSGDGGASDGGNTITCVPITGGGGGPGGW